MLLRYKFIISLSCAACLCASTSTLAFQGNYTPSEKTSASITHVSNETIVESAKKFVTKVTKEGIGILESSDASEEKREREFRSLLQNNFDMKTIGRFALGRYWRTSSKEEQKEYLSLFEDMIVNVYSRRFSDYNGQKIEITKARPEGKADAIVSSVIIPENGPEISVDWRVRKKKSGQLKIIDIMVEGVSMSLTQRSDFASVIQRGGGKIEVLLAHLRP